MEANVADVQRSVKVLLALDVVLFVCSDCDNVQVCC